MIREDAWRRALTGAGFWGVLGVGLWAVERRSDGETIGHVGFFDIQRDIEPSICGHAEMGWIFRRDAQGQGYAAEACQAVLSWFEEHFGQVPVWALISPGNDASMKVAARLGFVRQPDGTYRGKPETMWVRRKAESPTATAATASAAA